jgi:hypothetical protein
MAFKMFKSFKPFKPPPVSAPASREEDEGGDLSDWNFLKELKAEGEV